MKNWFGRNAIEKLSDINVIFKVKPRKQNNHSSGKIAFRLRMRPSYFARFTAEPLNKTRYCSTVKAFQSSSSIERSASEGSKSAIWWGEANRFQGQHFWQSFSYKLCLYWKNSFSSYSYRPAKVWFKEGISNRRTWFRSISLSP